MTSIKRNTLKAVQHDTQRSNNSSEILPSLGNNFSNGVATSKYSSNAAIAARGSEARKQRSHMSQVLDNNCNNAPSLTYDSSINVGAEKHSYRSNSHGGGGLQQDETLRRPLDKLRLKVPKQDSQLLPQGFGKIGASRNKGGKKHQEQLM